MERLGVAAAIINAPHHVLYLTGYPTPPTHHSAVILQLEGGCTLVSPASDEKYAVDKFHFFEPSALATLRLDQALIVADKVDSLLKDKSGRIGLDKGGASAYLGELASEMIDLEPELIQLRRRKDPDEVALLKKGIAVTHACYSRARDMLAPGISELEMYAALYSTAVQTAGEAIPAIGNDFQCGTPGGPPTQRRAKAGELYIFDLGCVIAGYNADNCRTFAVDGEPTGIQLKAWKRIVEVFTFVEATVSPGVSCRRLYGDVKAMLDADWPGSFTHHLGHGVGLSPHEQPNLNPHWDHVFEEGDFFTVEPGLYEPELRGGIRLEENYLVTATGIEKLTSFPLEL
jgi:Xaa-Pro aminopeptidase